MIKTEQFEKVEIISAEDLRTWLLKNHTQSESVWLVTYKKSEAGKYVSREEVLDALLCFGWIDGIRRKLDEKRTMQLISPRKTEHWARSYKERAAKLIENGSIHEAGLRAIEVSKSKGLWDYMDDVDVCRSIAIEILDYSQAKNIPVGFNTKSVSIRKEEIDASIELPKDVRKMMA